MRVVVQHFEQIHALLHAGIGRVHVRNVQFAAMQCFVDQCVVQPFGVEGPVSYNGNGAALPPVGSLLKGRADAVLNSGCALRSRMVRIPLAVSRPSVSSWRGRKVLLKTERLARAQTAFRQGRPPAVPSSLRSCSSKKTPFPVAAYRCARCSSMSPARRAVPRLAGVAEPVLRCSTRRRSAAPPARWPTISSGDPTLSAIAFEPGRRTSGCRRRRPSHADNPPIVRLRTTKRAAERVCRYFVRSNAARFTASPLASAWLEG